MAPREVTLAQCFRASGYRAGIFGKWHLGDNYPCRPQDFGFDEVAVCGGGGVWQTPDHFGNDYFDDTYLHNGTPTKSNGFCESHAELSKVMENGSAYILNCRNDRRVLHRATCSFAETMSPRDYEKLYFDDLSEARAWCNENFGQREWKRCGYCS